MNEVDTCTIDILNLSNKEVQCLIDEEVSSRASDGYVLKKVKKFKVINAIVLYFKKEAL